VNTDVRVLLTAGERALRGNNRAEARALFLKAGQTAAGYQLWRVAQRCYRLALELDLVDREPVERILRLPSHNTVHAEWNVYARALDRHAWPSFGCRSARIVAGGPRTWIECPGIGTVMELEMPDDDLIDVEPVPRLVGMPLAMAMMIVRRAMWMAPRYEATCPHSLRVAFDNLPQVWLGELGEWVPVVQRTPAQRAPRESAALELRGQPRSPTSQRSQAARQVAVKHNARDSEFRKHSRQSPQMSVR
jgi:hypothetical protein